MLNKFYSIIKEFDSLTNYTRVTQSVLRHAGIHLGYLYPDKFALSLQSTDSRYKRKELYQGTVLRPTEIPV